MMILVVPIGLLILVTSEPMSIESTQPPTLEASETSNGFSFAFIHCR
jgi:hypothetical protein